MTTHADETVQQRYAREHAEHLTMLSKMTAEQIFDLELCLHNAEAKIAALEAKEQGLRQQLAITVSNGHATSAANLRMAAELFDKERKLVVARETLEKYATPNVRLSSLWAQEALAIIGDVKPTQHDLYKDGDANIPESILDRNGQVVLGLCKRCGKGEVELSEPCKQPARFGKSDNIRHLAENIMTDCGCSTQHEDLLNKVEARLWGYFDAQPASTEESTSPLAALIATAPVSQEERDERARQIENRYYRPTLT